MTTLFPIIGSSEARRYVAIGRSTPNQVREQIAAALNLRGRPSTTHGWLGGKHTTVERSAPLQYLRAREPLSARDCSNEPHALRMMRPVGEIPTARTNHQDPADESAHCYRCDRRVVEPCDGWMCPMERWSAISRGSSTTAETTHARDFTGCRDEQRQTNTRASLG